MEEFDPELGFKVMFRFLENYYEMTGADDIGILLGSMNTSLFADGRPADPAIWEDWLDAVREVAKAD